MILQRVIESEVEEFPSRGRYERSSDGALRGHRNGYEPKRLHTAEGSIMLEALQVRNALEPFESAWLPAIGKRSSRLG